VRWKIFYPYGGIRLDAKTNYGGIRNKYAGCNDALMSLNYMQARYQNAGRGQFVSDPIRTSVWVFALPLKEV